MPHATSPLDELLTLRRASLRPFEWFDDTYDKGYQGVAQVRRSDWRVVRSARLQGTAHRTQQLFIGDFAFSPDERLAVVARPFSGDVLAVDERTLMVVDSVRIGQQPLEVAALPGAEIVVRDWKTGALHTGRLSRHR